MSTLTKTTPIEAVELLRAARIVPVVTIDAAERAVPLGQALIAGGLPCAEITYRTAAAGEAIRRLSSECRELFVGAGTVLTRDQAVEAVQAGAQFIVAPGFNPVVVDWCVERSVPVFPGVCTPTEIEMALSKGLSVLKFFPAEPAGGLTYLKAVAAPYVGVSFIPTGGINATNLATYLKFARVIACGGSWMVAPELIAAGRFDEIRAETARAVEIAGEAR